MNALDPVEAVRRIETNRATAFAFEIVGHVTAADVENLYGLLEGAYALHDKIDLLVKITDYDGVDWGAVSKATTEDGRRHALDHVRRCAAVGEPNWTSAATGFFAAALPVELRHFDAQDEEAAWEWIGARPA
ncbi:MAG: STAS/SEC14 domain-containing protein [Pseudaminobacter sp.]|nr:STAS/SEC14 domain-containing protein [Pseudaminobacter sp.]